MNLNLENLFSVKDKVGIVTGGSRGIGEMIASGFLANKAKVNEQFSLLFLLY